MSHFHAVFSRRSAWLAGALLIAALSCAVGWRYLGAPTATSAAAGDDGTRILLGLAVAAQRDGRLVAPVGSNAFEFYFSVLQIDPHNRAALDGLREAFKPASATVEHTIAAGELDEAQRELQLLRAWDVGNYRYDPAHVELHSSNYRLVLLGSYLDAQRKLQRQRHAEEAAAIRARQAEATMPQ